MECLVFIADVPQTTGVWECGDALEDESGRANEEGPVGDVRMASDPTTVGSAPPDVIRVGIENVPETPNQASEIAHEISIHMYIQYLRSIRLT